MAIPEYKNWRISVFERDKYICQICGRSGLILNADHIQAFALILEEYGIDNVEKARICSKLWDITNGRTLCVPCHRKTRNYGIKVKTKI